MKKNIFTSCLFYILAFSVITIQAQTNKGAINTTEKANTNYENWNNTNSGGAAIAVVKNGKVVFDNAYGMANLEYGIPNTVNTIFHSASLSKQFTAYAILILEQEGKLSLDDDIRKYIPEVPDFGKTITLRHLASHTSGLRDQWRLLYLAGWRPEDVVFTKDVLELVSKQKDLNFDPGSKLMYSNTGFTLLAEVVARVSGQSFAEFTQARIFTPLHMTNSQFYDDHQKIVKNRAYSYNQEGDVIKKNKLNFSIVGPTNLFTTVIDLSKWAMHLNTLDKRNKELSKRMNQQAYLNNGEITEAAMGQWTGVTYKGLEWFDHTGSDASFRAYFSRFPESNSAVVILANTTPFNASGMALQTADVFLNDLYKTTPKKTTEAKQKTKKEYQFIQLSKNQLSKFCGKYWEPEELYTREIRIINDTLTYYRSETSQTKLLPVSNNEFKMLGDSEDVSVFFEKNEQGEPIARVKINDNRPILFLKYQEDFSLDDYYGTYYSPEVNGAITVSVSEGNLQVQLFKKDPVTLTSIKKDLFISSGRTFKNVEFIRNKKGEISTLSLSNGGVTNMKFQKEE